MLFGIFALISYLFISSLFLFKSEWIVSRLKLERHFTESRIDITISQKTVLKIIIILFGGITLINSFPNLVQEIIQFLQQNELLKNYRDVAWLIFHSINTLIGYLLITNSNGISRFIYRQKEK